MVRKAEKQVGFAAVEAVLIVIALCMVTFTGWFVLQAKQNTDKSLDAATNSKQASIQKNASKSTKSAAPKQGEPCTLEDGSKGVVLSMGPSDFTFCHPNGWTLYHTEVPGAFYSNYEDMRYDVSKEPKSVAVGGSDGVRELYVYNKLSEGEAEGYTKLSSRKTAGEGTLDTYYHLTTANDPIGAGIDYLPEGTKQYFYLVTNGDRKLEYHYLVLESQTDNNKFIEAIAASSQK